MAQTRKKRRRKHRGTQTGRIDTRGPRGRPRTKEEARARARQKRKPAAKSRGALDRRDVAPTWGGAFKRGLFGAAIFFLLFWLLFKRDVGQAAVLSVVMLAMYVPMGYYIDRFMYSRRLRQLQAERAAKKQQG
jgi:hypothetical protein